MAINEFFEGDGSVIGLADCIARLDELPSTEGNFRTDDGELLAVDLSMMKKPLDISQMTLDWVWQTEDPFFADLERNNRHLLYLVFVKEMDRQGIADSLGCDVQDVTRNVLRVLTHLRKIVQLEPVRWTHLSEYHAKFPGGARWKVTAREWKWKALVNYDHPMYGRSVGLCGRHSQSFAHASVKFGAPVSCSWPAP